MKLVELAENGINIEIVTRNNPQIVDEVILKALSHRPNITLHTAMLTGLIFTPNIFCTMVTYQDKNPDEPEVPKKILWVGSHNFTGMAMRNNYETWSEVRDDKIFQAYSENFSELGSLVPVDPDSGILIKKFLIPLCRRPACFALSFLRARSSSPLCFSANARFHVITHRRQ